MALEEKIKVDQIEVTERNCIQVRTATIIEKDGSEISRVYHRHVVSPGDNVSNEDEKVQAIANAIWNEKIIEEYLEYINTQINR